jgi:nucleotide-binding universal stress UspA family protein
MRSVKWRNKRKQVEPRSEGEASAPGTVALAEERGRSMSGIVCAVRGGPHSQPTIARAIRLAQDTGQQLFFLYVVNLDFMSHTSRSRVHTISEQMAQMGEFILLTAQEAAAREGVKAEGLIRHGDVGEEIIDLCHELEADYLVLGMPRFQQEDALFSKERLRVFVAQTEERTGAKVVLPEGEEL